MTNILATAEALVDNGQYGQALLLYDQLVAAYPYAAQHLRRRALARRMTEDFAGALSDLDKVISQDPDNAVAYWQRGACRAHRLSRAENIPSCLLYTSDAADDN